MDEFTRENCEDRARQRAYDEGFAAYDDGQDLSDCPYSRYGFAENWVDGWGDAKKRNGGESWDSRIPRV